jgi:hypothetical protein
MKIKHLTILKCPLFKARHFLGLLLNLLQAYSISIFFLYWVPRREANDL